MKLAIMQPYFMPYIGYFQLIQAVDAFVFYDDVNFIKSGWVNRNRILINGEAKYFTVPLLKASQNKLINEVEINTHSKEYLKLQKTIETAYKKAPYFELVIELIKELFSKRHTNVAEIAMESVKLVTEYLGLKTRFLISSVDFSDSKGMEKAERLIFICKQLNANTYINAVGGRELYSRETFSAHNIKLQFIQSKPVEYKQFNNKFVPWLSILDVLMFNSAEEVNKMLDEYELV